MTNDNHKSNCCGAEIRLSDVFINGVVPKMWCQKCNEPCDPKPSPAPKCEHDGINVWLGGVTGYMSKAMYETCPFCKPATEVEPKCEHDKVGFWENGRDFYGKAGFPKCPICKPVEPKHKQSIHGLAYCDNCEDKPKPVEPSWESIDKKEADRVDRAILDALPVEPSVDIKKDCWLFTGRIEKSGYGRKGGVSAHRLSYQTFVGKIPKGKFVLHKCDVRNCINPNHLYLGTSKDNMRDCLERGRHPRLNRNSCGRGHPYTKDTIQYKYSRGQKYRYCKECEYIKRKQRQEKKRLRNERNRK